MADGHLNFDTKMNTSGFKAGISQIIGMFGKLAAAAGVALSVAAVVQFGKAAVQAASDMQAKFKGLEFLMSANGRSMQQATSFIQEFTADGLVPMTSAYEAYKNMVSRGYETDQIEKMLNVMKDAAVYARQGQFSMGEAIEKATMGLRMENSLLTDSVGIQKNVAKMWQEYAREIGATANNLTMAQKRQAEFNGFMREGGVFAGAAAGYTNTYAGRMAKLSASFLNLKVSVGNAIIPVINAILPYISAAIDHFTRLFNIVGRVMNLLFGTNVGMVDAQAAMAQNAQATADATKETADNTERAGKAAKGALAAFDKLNVLNQKTESGTGTGTGTGVVVPGLPVEPGTGGIGKELDELEEKVARLKDKIIAFFAPFKPAFDNFKEGIKNFKDAFLDAFKSLSDPESPIGGFAIFLRDVLALALEGVSYAFLKLSEWAKNNPAEFQGVILTFGLVAASIFLITHPVAAVIVGIIALIAAITWLIKNWDLVKEKAKEVWEKIKGWWSEAGEWFKVNVTAPISNWFTSAWANISRTVTGVWNAVKTAWGEAVDWFKTMVVDPISNAFETAWKAIGGFITKAFTGIAETVKSAINGVIGFLNGLLVNISAGINDVIGFLNSISFTAPSWLGGKTYGISLPTVSTPQIPYLASGAVIPPNAPFAAVMGDQRSGRNLEAPESLIRKIVREEAGAFGGGTLTLRLEGTMAALIRELKPHLEFEYERAGGTMIAKAVRL